MSLYSRNRVSLKAVYGPPAVYDFRDDPVQKLTMIVQGDSAMLSVSQENPPILTGLDEMEMEILPGFSTRVFTHPLYGFRFRSRTGQACTVTFVAQ